MKEGNLKDRKHQKQDVLKIGCTQIGCTKNRRIYYVWCVLLLHSNRVSTSACDTCPELYSSQLTYSGVTLSPPGQVKNTRTACDIRTTQKNLFGRRLNADSPCSSPGINTRGCKQSSTEPELSTSFLPPKNIIGSTKNRKAQRKERILRRNHSQEVTNLNQED